MEIPKTLKIGPYVIKVIFPYTFRERDDLKGQFDYTALEIRIADEIPAGSPKLRDRQVWQTFLHEVAHAIDIISGHRIFSDKNENNGKEKALEGITTLSLQVLIDNGYLDLDI